MKKLLFTAIIIALNFSNASAQDDTAANQYKMLNQHLHSVNPYLFEKDDNGQLKLNFNNFKGSPYENNKYVSGLLVDELNNKKTKVYLRYNIYNDQIEMKTDIYHPAEAVLREADISCVMNGLSYHFLTFTNDRGSKIDGYLVLLFKGKNYSLYKRLTSKFTPKEEEIDNSYRKAKKASFSLKVSYYIKQGNNISYLPYKKKKLLKNYPELNKNLKTYINKTHPNLKKKDDLIGLVRYLDTQV